MGQLTSNTVSSRVDGDELTLNHLTVRIQQETRLTPCLSQNQARRHNNCQIHKSKTKQEGDGEVILRSGDFPQNDNILAKLWHFGISSPPHSTGFP